MSVWKSACYRDDAIQWYLRNTIAISDDSEFVHSLCDFDIGDFGHFPVPDGLQSGNLEVQIDKNGELLRRLQANTSQYTSKALAYRAKKLRRGVFGVRAVYELAVKFRRIYDAIEVDFSSDKPFLESLTKLGFAASSHSAADYANRKHITESLLHGNYAKAKAIIYEIVRFRGYHKARSYNAEIREAEALDHPYPSIPENIPVHLRNWTVYSFPGMLILVDPISDIPYVLNSNDVERLDRLLSGIELARIYLLGYGDIRTSQSKALLKAYDNIVDLFHETIVNTDRFNEVCRAFDVAYHLALAKYCAPDDSRALKEQTDKWQKEKLGVILDLTKYLRIIEGLRSKEKIEVCMFYKALPQPDFDYFGAAKRQFDMYEENVAAALEDGAADGPMFDEILLYHRWTMMYAFDQAHGRLPGFIKNDVEEKEWHKRFPHLPATEVDFLDMNDIDFNGEFSWRGRQLDILDLVNDKAICPSNIRDDEMNKDYRSPS